MPITLTHGLREAIAKAARAAAPAAKPPATSAPAKTPRKGRDVSTEAREPKGSAHGGEWTVGTNPSAQAPKGIVSILTSSLKSDPKRFQYKGDTNPITGAGEELKAVRKWDPDLAGILLVWRDPANGKTFAVNGHHRADLARRLKVSRLDVRYITAPNAEKAMVKGALTNIAEGRGTVLDAARLLRSQHIGAKQLEQAGISLSGGIAAVAEPLTSLCDTLWHQVATEKMTPARGAIIAKTFTSPAEQMALDTMLNRPDVKRKRLSDAAIGELKHFIQSAGKRTKTLDTLFGTESLEQSLAIEKAQLSASVKARLTADKRLFGFVSQQGRADKLRVAGNVIAAGKNKEISEDASRVIELYDKAVGYKGIISTLLNHAAEELAGVGNQREISDTLYGHVRATLTADAGGMHTDAAGPRGREADDHGTEGVANVPQDDGGLFKSTRLPQRVRVAAPLRPLTPLAKAVDPSLRSEAVRPRVVPHADGGHHVAGLHGVTLYHADTQGGAVHPAHGKMQDIPGFYTSPQRHYANMYATEYAAKKGGAVTAHTLAPDARVADEDTLTDHPSWFNRDVPHAQYHAELAKHAKAMGYHAIYRNRGDYQNPVTKRWNKPKEVIVLDKSKLRDAPLPASAPATKSVPLRKSSSLFDDPPRRRRPRDALHARRESERLQDPRRPHRGYVCRRSH